MVDALAAELMVIRVADDGVASAPEAWSSQSRTNVASSPRYSPNGTSLAFVRNTPVGGHGACAVMIADLATHTERVVLSASAITQIAWSPDGSEILCLLNQRGVASIRRINVATAASQGPLAIDAHREMAWAAGGGVIYQRSDRRNYTRLDLDTGVGRPLLAEDEVAVWQIRAAPDGRSIAFARTSDRASGMSVCVASIADGTVRVLYPGRAAPVGWSADGRRVFLVRDDPDEAKVGKRVEEVVACSVESGRIEPVAPLPGMDFGWSAIDVSADGRHIAYARTSTLSDVWVAEDFDPEVR